MKIFSLKIENPENSYKIFPSHKALALKKIENPLAGIKIPKFDTNHPLSKYAQAVRGVLTSSVTLLGNFYLNFRKNFYGEDL